VTEREREREICASDKAEEQRKDLCSQPQTVLTSVHLERLSC